MWLLSEILRYRARECTCRWSSARVAQLGRPYVVLYWDVCASRMAYDKDEPPSVPEVYLAQIRINLPIYEAQARRKPLRLFRYTARIVDSYRVQPSCRSPPSRALDTVLPTTPMLPSVATLATSDLDTWKSIQQSAVDLRVLLTRLLVTQEYND